MYTLIRSLSFRQLFVGQAPALGVSLLCAELFFRFHSFTLECAAFLATWYVVDLGIQSLRRSWGRAPDRSGPAARRTI